MKKYKGFQITWWLCFIYIILAFSLTLIIQTYLPTLNENIFSLILQSAILLPIIIGAILLKVNFPYDSLKNMLGIRSFNITFLVPLMLIPISSTFFLSFVTSPFNSFAYFIFGDYSLPISKPQDLTNFFYLLLSLCIIAPITEEIFFRGILLKFLDRFGTFTAVLISSLAFSLLHFDPSAFLTIFLMGIIMCIIRLGTGSLFSSIFFHVVNNLFSIMVTIFENAFTIPQFYEILFIIILAVMFPILTVIFFVFFSNKFFFQGTGEKTGFSIGFLLTMTIYIIFSISLAISNLFNLY